MSDRERALRELERCLRGSEADLRAAIDSGELARLAALVERDAVPANDVEA